MSKTSTRVGLGIGRGILDTVSLGIAEAFFRGQRFSHDIILAYTKCEKCGDSCYYTLEFLGSSSLSGCSGSSSSSSRSSSSDNVLSAGIYLKYSPIDGCYTFKPNNMKLCNLRSIMENNPGWGNCKDHAKLWWRKIKNDYS